MKIRQLLLLVYLILSGNLHSEEIWLNPGGETPAFKLILKENGNAEFVDGFTWLNPVKWERKGNYLKLHIEKMDTEIFEYMKYALSIDNGCLSSVNPSTIVYYEELCPYINIGGYFFYRQ